MDVFPAAFPLTGLRIVVAGEGEAAEAKARLFTGSPATLLRVSAAEANDADSYRGARLAFIAVAGSAAVSAATAARTAGALVNVVDRPELCDFNTPAIVDRGAVVGAIATGGAAPLLAAELRRELEAAWPITLGEVARLLQVLQNEARAALPAVADRRVWLRRLLDSAAPGLAMAGDMAGALTLARSSLDQRDRAGRLSILVPPSSPDLLSLRALQALGRADWLVVAEGVSPVLVSMARRDAPVSRLEDVDPQRVAAQLAARSAIVCIGPVEAFTAFGPAQMLAVAA